MDNQCVIIFHNDPIPWLCWAPLASWRRHVVVMPSTVCNVITAFGLQGWKVWNRVTLTWLPQTWKEMSKVWCTGYIIRVLMLPYVVMSADYSPLLQLLCLSLVYCFLKCVFFKLYCMFCSYLNIYIKNIFSNIW